jgi:hypothetical protein
MNARRLAVAGIDMDRSAAPWAVKGLGCGRREGSPPAAAASGALPAGAPA